MGAVTEDLFAKRRQIRAAWDNIRVPNKELVHDLLKRTLDIAPSKQNLFPFKIHAYGPNDTKEKHTVSQICNLWKTGSVNHWDDENNNGNIKSAEGNLNIKNMPVFDHEGNDMRLAPWVLVFEQRLAEPNGFVKEYSQLHNDYSRFTQTDPKRFRDVCNTKLTCIEIGMFIQTLAGLCLENNLGISYIRSFPEWRWASERNEYKKDINKHGLGWDSLPDITEAPLMIVQLGYVADVVDFFQSNSLSPNKIHWENKPDIDSIAKFK